MCPFNTPKRLDWRSGALPLTVAGVVYLDFAPCKLFRNRITPQQAVTPFRLLTFDLQDRSLQFREIEPDYSCVGVLG